MPFSALASHPTVLIARACSPPLWTHAERTLLIRLPFERLRYFLTLHPPLEAAIVDNTKHSLLQRYAAMHSSIFHSFSVAELGAGGVVDEV